MQKAIVEEACHLHLEFFRNFATEFGRHLQRCVAAFGFDSGPKVRQFDAYQIVLIQLYPLFPFRPKTTKHLCRGEDYAAACSTTTFFLRKTILFWERPWYKGVLCHRRSNAKRISSLWKFLSLASSLSGIFINERPALLLCGALCDWISHSQCWIPRRVQSCFYHLEVYCLPESATISNETS